MIRERATTSILIFACLSAIAACDNREEVLPHLETDPIEAEGQRQGRDHLVESDLWRNELGYTASSDKYPSRDKVERGLLSGAGIRNGYKEIVGLDMPDWVSPRLGLYNVSKYDPSDRGNYNAYVQVYCEIDPERAQELQKIIVDSWENRFDKGDVRIGQNVLRKEFQDEKAMTFSEGSLNAYCFETDDGTRDTQHSYRLLIDPMSGYVRLQSFRGREE